MIINPSDEENSQDNKLTGWSIDSSSSKNSLNQNTFYNQNLSDRNKIISI